MNEILNFYRTKLNTNILNKLIGINIIVFIISQFLPETALVWFYMPTHFLPMLGQPWSPLTSMFMHDGFSHIFFNLIWLFWMGEPLLAKIGEKSFLKLFIIGGLITASGVIFYRELTNILTYGLCSTGAMSTIVFASIFMRPNESIQIFLWNIKMKYIAWFLIVSSLIGLLGDNDGGSAAHLVGSIYGYVWIKNKLGHNILKDIIDFKK